MYRNLNNSPVDTDEETNLRYCWRSTDETGSVERSIAVGCSQLKLSPLLAERRVHLNRESLSQSIYSTLKISMFSMALRISEKV
ncbi:MAG: hypothetical protein V2I33_23990, partial [Kangiellaceae bacterium]|nr:hypothetical protein [Kangiellaceae bacterium]